MAIQTLNGDKTGTGLQFDLGTDDSLLLGASAFLVNESTASGINENLIAARGSLQVVTILGTAYAYGDAVLLGDSPSDDSSQRLFIGKEGYLGSQAGIGVYLRCTSGIVENWGTIDGAVGIGVISALATDPTSIENHGLIRARETDAIYLSSSGQVEIVNSGTITGGGESALDAISSGGAISIVNTGSITGMVHMGLGKDSYDGRRGSVDGLIDGYWGNDTIRGGSGGEQLAGNLGRDLLYGGGGADMFIYLDDTDSTNAKSGRDLIGDFSHKSHDVIDLSELDALATTLDNDDFTFIGTAAFSASGAEARYVIKGNSTFLYLSTDTDRPPEMTVELTGRIHFVQSDFEL